MEGNVGIKEQRLTWDPVSVAMSCRLAFRFSPNPGAFTAATWHKPVPPWERTMSNNVVTRE